MATAYDRVMALKLAQEQAKQRDLTPEKVAQKLLREWLGAQGFGAAIDPMAGADLVRRVEAVVIAERAGLTEDEIDCTRSLATKSYFGRRS
jgi:ABC-type branched-subunit amino acid transport system substrate-binding protein